MRRHSFLVSLVVVGCSTSAPLAPTDGSAARDASATDAAPAPGTDAAPAPGTDAAPTFADSGPRDVGLPPVQVGACDSLAAVGTWENITPPELPAEASVFAFAVDPVHAGTVYLGTIRAGIWRTADCGAHWAHIDTGRSARPLDTGMNWTFLIDPIEPEILYTNAGYGEGSNGVFRSTNGGVDWDPIWPPADPALSGAFENNFANTLSMDPNDRQHLLLSFHEPCRPPHPTVCVAETHDAGASWRLIDGDARWTTRGEGVRIEFLDDDHTWLWTSQWDGMWRTTDAGASWTQVLEQGANHLQATQLLRTQDGTYVLAGMGDLWVSPRGTSAGTWTMIPGTSPLPGGVVSDGETLYMSNCYYGDFCDPASSAPFYFTASESDPTSWTPLPYAAPSEMSHVGGRLGYDRTHHVLYSANLQRGFWRIVTR